MSQKEKTTGQDIERQINQDGASLIPIGLIDIAKGAPNEYIGVHPKARYYDSVYWRELRENFGVPEFQLTDNIDVLYWLEKARSEGWLEAVKLKARGQDDKLDTGGLPENINIYLNMLIFLTGGPPGPIGRQFIGDPNVDRHTASRPEFQEFRGFVDSLEEDDHAVVFDRVNHRDKKREWTEDVPCLIHKYKDRVLMLVTRTCAAYCDYCTRGRMVGFGVPTSKEALGRSFDYIAKNKGIREIIFSGGDGMLTTDENFEYVIQRTNELIEAGHNIESVRFGTRSIIHNGITPGTTGEGKPRPTVITERKIEALSKLKTTPHIMLHICHPWEITEQVKEWMKILSERAHAQFHSQSVLLANVNDDREVLKALFKKIQGTGIQPYYVYLCDLVEWGLHFLVSIPKARELFYKLKNETGGLVIPSPVVDVAQGEGKIPLFSEYWISDRLFEDYNGDLFIVIESWHEPYNPIKHGLLTAAEMKELNSKKRDRKEKINSEKLVAWSVKRLAFNALMDQFPYISS